MVTRRRALRVLELTTFASFAEPLELSQSFPLRNGRNRGPNRSRQNPLDSGTLIEVDDEERVEHDLMDFLLPSSSSSDDSESSEGVVALSNAQRQPRTPRRRTPRIAQERLAPVHEAEEAPIPQETDLESGVRYCWFRISYH